MVITCHHSQKECQMPKCLNETHSGSLVIPSEHPMANGRFSVQDHHCELRLLLQVILIRAVSQTRRQPAKGICHGSITPSMITNYHDSNSWYFYTWTAYHAGRKHHTFNVLISALLFAVAEAIHQMQMRQENLMTHLGLSSSDIKWLAYTCYLTAAAFSRKTGIWDQHHPQSSRKL